MRGYSSANRRLYTDVNQTGLRRKMGSTFMIAAATATQTASSWELFCAVRPAIECAPRMRRNESQTHDGTAAQTACQYGRQLSASFD